MATGFKTASVQSGKVPSTQTDCPVYVDLSRLGITTLAEANSVRVYSDAARTTELARQIVSATEMWVKVASLAVGTAIYVDWDGSRSNYAVTDTYGRNAVWTGFAAVWHGDDLVDSSGNQVDLTNVNSATVGSATSKIGKAFSFDDASNQYLTLASAAVTSEPFTLAAWVKSDDTTVNQTIISLGNNGASGFWRTSIAGAVAGDPFRAEKQSDVGVNAIAADGTYSSGVWYYVVGVFAGTSDRTIYHDATGSQNTSGATSPTADSTAIGMLRRSGITQGMSGQIDEARIATSALSADRITTNFNNQGDEAAFWGSWTEATQGSGAATVTASLSGAGTLSLDGSGAATISVSASGAGQEALAGDGAADIDLTLAADGTLALYGDGAATITITLSGGGPHVYVAGLEYVVAESETRHVSAPSETRSVTAS